MANMLDYVLWRGDIGMDYAPFNAIDALLFSSLCYLDFAGVDNQIGHTLAEADREGLVQDRDHSLFPSRKQVFEAMARSRRFGECRMHHFITLTDKEAEMQFSVVCYDLPDGTGCVAFRGTDATVVGWREDMNMSVLDPVPGQEAALYYMQKLLEKDGGPIRIMGHSKGGNLGIFAAAHLSAAMQDRISEIWSFDAPGMAPDVFNSEGYQRIAPKIHHFVPQTSIVGLMLEYPRPYTVVHSTASGMQQHDILSWQIIGPRFEEMDSVDENAITIRDTLHEWVDRSDKKQRAAFVDAAFQILESTNVTTVGELKGEKMKNLRAMINGSRDLDPEMKKEFGKLMNLFLSLGADNVWDRFRFWLTEGKNGQQEGNARLTAGEKRKKKAGAEEEPARAEEIEEQNEPAPGEAAENESRNEPATGEAAKEEKPEQ